MTRFLIATFFAMLGLFNAYAQSGNPFIPDFAWCNTRGSVVTRKAVGWGCLTPGGAGQVVVSGGAGADASWYTPTGTGTVTSVGLTLPPIFTVSGSPVTAAGTLSASLASQTANYGWFAPNGSAGAPAFRAMVAVDMPNAGIFTGDATTTFPALTIGTGAITAAKIANATITTTQISGTAGITGGQIASATIANGNLANMAAYNLLGTQGTAGPPTYLGWSTFMDQTFTNTGTPGIILWRDPTRYQGIVPGTAGQYLTTTGSAPAYADISPAIQTKSAGWTVSGTADNRRRFVYTASSDATVTLPAGSGTATGFNVLIKHSGGTGILTLAPNGADTIDIPTIFAREETELFWDGSQWRTFGVQTRVLLASGAVSGTGIDNVLPTGYSAYEIDFQEFTPSTATFGVMLLSQDGGVMYPGVAGSYSSSSIQAAGGAVSGTNNVTMGGTPNITSQQQTNANFPASSSVKLSPGSATIAPVFLAQSFSIDNTNGSSVATWGYTRNITGRATNVRLGPFTGTATFKYRLWGIR